MKFGRLFEAVEIQVLSGIISGFIVWMILEHYHAKGTENVV